MTDEKDVTKKEDVAEEKKEQEKNGAEKEKKVEASAEEKKKEAPSVEEKKVNPTTDAQDDSSSEESEVEVPEKFVKLVEQVEEMSVLELNELVKVLEKKFGVSAIAVAAGPAAGGGDEEEQSSFTVELTSFGEQKIAVIKVVKEISGLGLKEAKDLVEGAPEIVKEDLKKEEAEEIKTKLEGAGATVTLK